jgi:hypothetical protein
LTTNMKNFIITLVQRVAPQKVQLFLFKTRHARYNYSYDIRPHSPPISKEE